jgi:hypothetical protein
MRIIAKIILPVDEHQAVAKTQQVCEKVACHSAQSRMDNHPHSRRQLSGSWFAGSRHACLPVTRGTAAKLELDSAINRMISDRT